MKSTRARGFLNSLVNRSCREDWKQMEAAFVCIVVIRSESSKEAFFISLYTGEQKYGQNKKPAILHFKEKYFYRCI